MSGCFGADVDRLADGLALSCGARAVAMVANVAVERGLLGDLAAYSTGGGARNARGMTRG